MWCPAPGSSSSRRWCGHRPEARGRRDSNGQGDGRAAQSVALETRTPVGWVAKCMKTVVCQWYGAHHSQREEPVAVADRPGVLA